MPTKHSPRKVEIRDLSERHRVLEKRLKRAKDPILVSDLKKQKLAVKDRMQELGAAV